MPEQKSVIVHVTARALTERVAVSASQALTERVAVSASRACVAAVVLGCAALGLATTASKAGLRDEAIVAPPADRPRADFGRRFTADRREIAAWTAWAVALIKRFIKAFNSVRQHDPGWYASMATTVGGSEIAALMGINPYMSFMDVVESKIRRLDGDTSWEAGEACWWGTLKEDVIAACVAIDLGCEVLGDDICIQALPGHRYSPDGYAAVRFYRDGDGRLRIWTTDMGADIPVIVVIVLLEFKCPLSRMPKGTVPMYYRPQVQSGLTVSSVAQLGLFAEAVFRKCAVADMGDTPEYDAAHHPKDAERADCSERYPLAWGLIYVYAPLSGAPRRVRLGWRGDAWAAGDPTAEGPDADGALAAAAIHSQYFGVRPPRGEPLEPVDFGEMASKPFVRALGLIDRKLFPVVRGPPCFADGRGAALRTGRDVTRALAAATAAAPAHHWLLGVLPWKLFSIDYHCLARQPGFAELVRPLIDEVHRTVAEARAAPNRGAYLAAKRREKNAERGVPDDAPREPALGADDLQDLFDACALGDDA